MVKKEHLGKFLKLATDRIIAGLDSDKWSGEERDAAVTVLKNRGKDVSKYLEASPALKPASEEEVNELASLINAALEKSDTGLINKIDSLIGDVDNIKSLPAETVQFAIESIKKWKGEKKVKKEIIENKHARAAAKMKKAAEVVLTDEKKAIVDEVMADKTLTKKQKVLKMWERGLTRTETLSLHFMDPTYIYDLYREWAHE